MKKGLLLINLGTPDNCDTASVRRYLKEFLSDKRVIDLPAPIRYLLLYGVILPFRPKQSAHAYQAIWTEEGSPLLLNSLSLKKKLQEKLADDYQVALGMRYGKPSLETALAELSMCSAITILPLYPQYSSAATGSTIEKIMALIAEKSTHPSVHIIRDFYNQPAFIQAQAELIKPYIANHDHLLLSYHGVPERHIMRAGCSKVCTEACPPVTEMNQTCYRAQCYATSTQLADYLQLDTSRYSTAFQSRLGKTPWIKPYTDECLPELARRGIKRLAVACPSFVADCLETIEEIGIRAREQWLGLGGEELTLIPCLNDSDGWVEAIISSFLT